jgi:hypothetical protein
MRCRKINMERASPSVVEAASILQPAASVLCLDGDVVIAGQSGDGCDMIRRSRGATPSSISFAII